VVGGVDIVGKDLLLLGYGGRRGVERNGEGGGGHVRVGGLELQGLHIEPVGRVEEEPGGGLQWLQHGPGPGLALLEGRLQRQRGRREKPVGLPPRGCSLQLVCVLVAAEGLRGVELAVAEMALEGACGGCGGRGGSVGSGGRWWQWSLYTTVCGLLEELVHGRWVCHCNVYAW